MLNVQKREICNPRLHAIQIDKYRTRVDWHECLCAEQIAHGSFGRAKVEEEMAASVDSKTMVARSPFHNVYVLIIKIS